MKKLRALGLIFGFQNKLGAKNIIEKRRNNDKL